MIRKLIIFLLLYNVQCYTFGQLPSEQIAGIKNKLHNSLPDSSKFNVYMDLSQGYRFSNVDSALYYTDRAIELSRAMNDPAAEANALSQKGFIVLETGDLPLSLQFEMTALR